MKKLLPFLLVLGVITWACKNDTKKTDTIETVNEVETESEIIEEVDEVLEEETKKEVEDIKSTKQKVEKKQAADIKYEDTAVAEDDPVKVKPISHGTLVLEFEKMVIYVDPVGGAENFASYRKPTIILVTDIHGDHLNVETIEAVKHTNTLIVVPHAVAEKLPKAWEPNVSVINNGQTNSYTIGTTEISIEAIPMYNLRKEALEFHPKYRGNGYVITMGNQRTYISGDTEDIPEMRALKNIDKAFICMNLPYTMTVERAADAVLEFKPKVVYPYHYRGTDGMSDVEKFKKLVTSKNQTIDVRLLNWY